METQRELLKGSTPTLILAVLRDGPIHGYAIAREIERRSGQALRCKEGTLYPVLHALEQQGLIAGEWQTEDSGRPRKVYVLTPAGHTALDERTRTWSEFASAIERVLKGDSDHAAPEPEPRGRRPSPFDRPEPAL
jgi:PadR family transcriptional regulator PadR